MTNAFARDRRTGSNSLYSRLIEAFERDRVAYCFWRSGRRVEAALSGTSDLDIIVRRSDQHVAQACLLDLDFKEFASVGYLDTRRPCPSHRPLE
jgi:hypothetical protein